MRLVSGDYGVLWADNDRDELMPDPQDYRQFCLVCGWETGLPNYGFVVGLDDHFYYDHGLILTENGQNYKSYQRVLR